MSQNPTPQHTTLVTLIDRLVKWRKARRETRKAAIAARWVERAKQDADEAAWIDKAIETQRAQDRANKLRDLAAHLTANLVVAKQQEYGRPLNMNEVNKQVIQAQKYAEQVLEVTHPK